MGLFYRLRKDGFEKGKGFWLRYTVTVIALLFIFSHLGEGYRATTVTFPNISAEAATVIDADNGRILYEKNGDKRMRIASTTKIMTAIIILENCDPDEVVEITLEHYAEGSSMYLKEGEEVTVQDLLYGLMLMSGNDAALALAYHCSGGPESFAEMMNEKAAQIGMADSSFQNPNGLDMDGHYSTAKDMALLATYCMRNNDFREIVGKKSGHFGGRYMTNSNKLLHRLEGCTGLKTGYTKAAGRCLVSSVKRNGREIVVVTLSAPNDWNDHTVLHNRAFDAYNQCITVSKGEKCVSIPVQSGTLPNVWIRYAEDCSLWIAEGEEVESVIYTDKFVYAPVRAATPAGEKALFIDGKEVMRIPLEYSENINLAGGTGGLFASFSRFLKDVVSGFRF